MAWNCGHPTRFFKDCLFNSLNSSRNFSSFLELGFVACSCSIFPFNSCFSFFFLSQQLLSSCLIFNSSCRGQFFRQSAHFLVFSSALFHSFLFLSLFSFHSCCFCLAWANSASYFLITSGLTCSF